MAGNLGRLRRCDRRVLRCAQQPSEDVIQHLNNAPCAWDAPTRQGRFVESHRPTIAAFPVCPMTDQWSLAIFPNSKHTTPTPSAVRPLPVFSSNPTTPHL